MQYCSWRTNSLFVNIPGQMIELRPSGLLQTEVSTTAPDLQMEKLNGSKLFSKPYAKSVTELWVNASQLDPTPRFVLFTHLLYARKWPRLDCGRQFCVWARPGAVVIRTFLWRDTAGGGFTPPSPAARAHRGSSPPAAPDTTLLAICTFPGWWEFFCLKTREGCQSVALALFGAWLRLRECSEQKCQWQLKRWQQRALLGREEQRVWCGRQALAWEWKSQKKTKEERSWYIFFLLDNRTGLTEGRIRMLGITFRKIAV